MCRLRHSRRRWALAPWAENQGDGAGNPGPRKRPAGRPAGKGNKSVEEKILCSVVIPVYRCEKYLAEAVRSALGQTVGSLEVLLIDDCSTEDRSGQVARGLAEQDSRVHYLRHGENRGSAAARNTGVQAARGEWVAFLDADDLWLPDKLERQLKALEGTGRVLCCTGAVFFREDGSRGDHLAQVPPLVGEKRLRYGNVVITSSVLVKREVMRQFPMERSDLQEDYIAWLKILRQYGDALGVNEPLVRYRILEGSKSYNKASSALRTWRTYRFMGWPLLRSIGYFCSYIVHGLRRDW